MRPIWPAVAILGCRGASRRHRDRREAGVSDLRAGRTGSRPAGRDARHRAARLLPGRPLISRHRAPRNGRHRTRGVLAARADDRPDRHQGGARQGAGATGRLDARTLGSGHERRQPGSGPARLPPGVRFSHCRPRDRRRARGALPGFDSSLAPDPAGRARGRDGDGLRPRLD